MPHDPELIELQTQPAAVQPSITKAKTNMLLAPTSTAQRLRHFPENVYDISAESKLTKFVKVLLGDAGAGQLRKRLLIQRMQATLQGSHFYDLDRFYGPLFGIRRNPAEALTFDPYQTTATREQWDEAQAKDASFRSRIEQFAKALPYGATPTGMELMAEAILSVDVDVYESFIQADSSFQTYGELEDQYGPGDPGGTYADMEGVSYGELEGLGLSRLSGNERRVFTVRPKRQITLAEAYDLRRVLEPLKPADSRLTINVSGVPLHLSRTIQEAWADSEHWEVIPKVATASLAVNPYQRISPSEPVEQPRPPFSGYQGEAWSYITHLAGVSASYRTSIDDPLKVLPVQRISLGGSRMDFSAEQAVLPHRMVQAGRFVSDGVLVGYLYDQGGRPLPEIVSEPSEAVEKLYADGVRLDLFNRVLGTLPTLDPFQQNPEHRYWATPERSMHDTTEEVLEIRLAQQSLVNYLTFEVSKYPCRVIVEVRDTPGASWEEVYRWNITDSFPKHITPGNEALLQEGHPQHSVSGHWQKLSINIDPVPTNRVRVRLRRIPGIPPKRRKLSLAHETVEVDYSLAVRAFDLGYRVKTRKDFDFLPTKAIASTRDIFGSQVQYEVEEQPAINVLDNELTAWRSEPQPINYAVVNLYLDTRAEGEGTVIDRFFLDPTHAGVHLSVYYSNDPEDPGETPKDFMAERTWTPIPRDYIVQKGYIHLPATRARYWKFEFTNLAAENYESFLAIDRQVRLFPQSVVDNMGVGYGHAPEALVPGMKSAITTAQVDRYRDALEILTTQYPPSQYRPTDALYVTDLNGAMRSRQESWVFGFLPWHQSEQAPRFQIKGQHRYEEVEVRHQTKIAYFAGLRTLKAYRANFEANDDPPVYFDTFDDDRNLSAGYTWTFDPGRLHTTEMDLPVGVEAQSRTFHSLNSVRAIQFATEQSSPVQLIPDPDFRNPGLASQTWDNPDDFRRVGDATLIYQQSDYSVLNVRYVVPPQKPLIPRGHPDDHTLVQPPPQPVFSYRPYEIEDEAAAAATEGGLASPLAGLSDAGRAYAAVRFTMQSEQTNPLILQVLDVADDSVLAEKELPARNGETVEDYVAIDIETPNTVVYLQLIQRGKSDDQWKVQSMALFDESIVWEFSVNGGGDWYEAKEIRNNDNGILTFPAPGNQLRFRVRAFRPNLWVSAYKIRPHYTGVGNARLNGTHRGPNLSYYDHDVPIHEDPMFTTWKKPVPYSWWAISRRFPILAVEGTIPTEFSSFFGRPLSETLDEPTMDVVAEITREASWEERLDFVGPILSIDRELVLEREVDLAVEDIIVVTFDEDGAWQVPPKVEEVTIEMWGGGGGAIGGGVFGGAWGASGGGYARSTLAVTPGESLDIFVGQGGSGGTPSGSGNGGESRVERDAEVLMLASGGDNGGDNVSAGQNEGDVVYGSGLGGEGDPSGGGGGGSGSGGPDATGQDGEDAVGEVGGIGGLGGGSGGRGGDFNQDGEDGQTPGGGGGGGGANETNGGAGGGGRVSITYQTDSEMTATGELILVPEGVIVAWPSTEESIPDGWSRVAALNDRYPKGIPNNFTNPGATGGSTQHSHSSGSHRHSISSHTHGQGNTGTSSGTVLRSRTESGSHTEQRRSHTHSRPTTNFGGGGNSGWSAPSIGNASNDVTRKRVIFIESDGTAVGIPSGAVVMFNSTVLPSGFASEDTDEADSTNTAFLKGAGAGQAGSKAKTLVTDHDHHVAAHTHGGASHGHSSGSTGSSTTESRPDFRAGVRTINVNAGATHTHAISIHNGHSGSLVSSGSEGTTGTHSMSVAGAPPYRRLKFIENVASPHLPLGTIAIWLRPLTEIPAGWVVCDGQNGTPDLLARYPRHALGSVGGIGGSSLVGHSHSGHSHSHSTNSHDHGVSVIANSGVNVLGQSGTATTVSTGNHTHGASSTGSRSPDSLSVTSASTGTEAYEPPHIEVAFIMLVEIIQG